MRKIALVLLVLTMIARAQEPAAPTGAAKETLDKMMQAYIDMKSGVITTDIKIMDPEMTGTEHSELRLLRPKKLYFHTTFTPDKQSPMEYYLVTDGKIITKFDARDPKIYLQGKLPDPIRAIDLSAYFYLGPGNFMLNAMTGEWSRVLGGRKLELQDGPVLRIISEDSVDEWTLDPATYRVVKVANYVKGQLMAEGTITYSRLGETIEDGQFEYTPPAGAERHDIERQE